jgi:hypothetical protein
MTENNSTELTEVSTAVVKSSYLTELIDSFEGPLVITSTREAPISLHREPGGQ